LKFKTLRKRGGKSNALITALRELGRSQLATTLDRRKPTSDGRLYIRSWRSLSDSSGWAVARPSKFLPARWELAMRRAPETWPNKSDNTPSVGIFFAFGTWLLSDTTPLRQASAYGEFRIHERSHESFWGQLVAAGFVPPGSEYDEYPRGRIAFNERTQQFSLLADRCILRDKKRVAEIMERMHLPAESTIRGVDSHYRCPHCLRNGE
jgi:hypothetical protein